MKTRILKSLAFCLVLFCLNSCSSFLNSERVLFDGVSLENWKISNFGGEGDVEVKDGAVFMDYGNPITGITWTGEELPRDNYFVEFEALKIDGNDFFVGLTFPVQESYCSLILGGWGGVTCGLSSFDFQDAANNETMTLVKFEKNQWYKIRMEVNGNNLRSFIDGKQIIDAKIDGRKVHIRPEVLVSIPLGVCAFETQVKYKNIKLGELK
ncbi:MAG: DUF1080 domain-containing protein [Lentisphaeraceae bacterium]|nr:DUF1080 domain-containing protein [Lentisphaeraceae bacterium]